MDSATAFIVVDVQQAFDDAGYWGGRNNPACEANVAALIEEWRAQDRPLVFVRHDSDEDGSPLRPGPAGQRLQGRGHRRARPAGDEAGQLVLLRRAGPRRVAARAGHRAFVLCGITTNHCCETTARMGGNLGYDVLFVLDAGAHVRPQGPDGGRAADELARATAANLHGEFATVVQTADLLGAGP